MSEIKISPEVNEIKEKIKSLNIGQVSELVESLKVDYNIQETAIVQPTAGTQAAEKVEEKGGNVAVKWVKMEKEGASIVPLLGDIVEVVKELKGEDITKLQAKKLAEGGEKIVLADIPRDKAEAFQKKMKEKGAIYLTVNRSPLFQGLPERDYAREQKKSYDNFRHERLPKLLTFYFPAEFNDYNNNIKISAENLVYQEPTIEKNGKVITETEGQARAEDCHKMQIQPVVKDMKEEKELPNLNCHIKDGFKIGKFSSEKKSFSAKELKSLLTQTQKQLQELELTNQEPTGDSEKPIIWQIKENKSKKTEKKLELLLEVLEVEEEQITISFRCEQEQKIEFCHLPKMNPQGNFIINGHDKVVVFQSVRAPSAIELKFLNSGLVVDWLDVLKTFAVSPELLRILFDEEDLNLDNYSEAQELEIGAGRTGLPHFLFTSSKGNSYFNIGKLGRRRYNQRIDIIQQLKDQKLAEDLLDKNGQVILKKNAIFSEKNLEKLANALQKKKMNSFSVPHSTNDLYIVKIKSPRQPEKVISVIGISEKLPEEKTFFDLADLICAVSYYINLHHGLGETEKKEDEDKLENQIIRRVGDLVYNIFDNKLGGFLQEISDKYLTNYLSQLKKVDFAKIPNLKDFDNLIRHFFNTSALVRLQNQNNSLAVISDGLVSSVMGLGGRNAVNATLAARNVDASFIGRYDPNETPEGRNTGLVRRITTGAEINEDRQITTPYFPVKNGVIMPDLVYLTSKEEKDKYIAHFNTKIDEKNRIVEETVMAMYQENFVRVSKEKINLIYSSFYHLSSVTGATIPFFHHNDATRMLMAINMQRQAVACLKNEEPLVASGIEASLLENSPLTVKAEEKGIVEYVDSQQIIIQEKNRKKKIYPLEQLVVSNKNTLGFSLPLVKKGESVSKGQMLACGNQASNGELSLGCNLRVAYFERLVKEDILTSFFVKKHTIIRHNTKYGPEIFTSSLPHAGKKQHPQLGKNGIVKIGSRVKGNDILIGKITPEPSPHKENEEELLLMSILGEKTRRFVNSSLRLPAEEAGIVYQVRRKKISKNKKDKDLELVEVFVSQKRKIEVGDKLTTRFGNKGVVAKIVPEADMPFDEEGPVDIIFNPLGIPTRMNIGQLLETVLASAAKKTGSKLLCRPFNSPSPEAIKEIIQEAGLENCGAKKLFDGQTGLPFDQDIYNGYIYTIKLNHMVADKFHARNVGPYSLIYQQPAKGRSQNGGQRFGGMEVDCALSHGASYNISEIYGPKSDDIAKRNLFQNSLVFDDRQIDLRSNNCESFNLSLQGLRGSGFDIRAFDHQGREIDFYEAFSRKSPKK
ncbi:7895_t:CDS:2 [Racocetra fulgida]|uniref:DNA-directed RNA polymerase n=1 Tax=Racocetra fulgida TaxID=60492 RepID=A0A9N8VF59_9GLOM|nr:7895_t:CDS:2 [Racocetra fulgida]